nr:MAG TPA: hypothetical protein [Caudoviricetes sp.]
MRLVLPVEITNLAHCVTFLIKIVLQCLDQRSSKL